MKLLIAFSVIIALSASSCSKSEKTSNTSTEIAAVSAKINGNIHTFYSPVTPTDTLAEEPVDSVGTAFWVAIGDTIGVFCSKTIGKDTVMMFVQAIMPKEKIGTYKLDWQGVNPATLENAEALPLNCYYGKFNDIDTTIAKGSNNEKARAEYLKKLANCKGSGTLSITSFKNNQLSGTFNFNSDLGSNLKATVTDGVFININKGYLN
jgi:hypothetical protein